ncbi:hypothetical protein E4U14_001329 [Claviceps sp. LM454 group G7]|nr:hypothetical protein E4U14_001329 [Claviceps sp. LM454 group G7]
MIKYGIEDDWHPMDSHDEELSPISIEFEAIRPIPELNLIYGCMISRSSVTGVAQGYAYQAAGPPLQNILCDQALERLTKEIFNPHNPMIFQASQWAVATTSNLRSGCNVCRMSQLSGWYPSEIVEQLPEVIDSSVKVEQ